MSLQDLDTKRKKRYAEILRTMEVRSTKELLSIWVENKHAVWDDDAIEAAKEVLEKRNVSLPPQNAAIKRTRGLERLTEGSIET